MNQRDLDLMERFPKILKNLGGDHTKTCMSWRHGGIDVGDGWFKLVEKLCVFAQHHHDYNGYPQLVFSQVKEKFGLLTIYYSFEECTSQYAETGKKREKDYEYIQGAIDFVESISSTICEMCGAPATRESTSGWISTLCKECKRNEF